MTGLTYTGDAARRLERTYLAKDIVAQRRETLRRLRLSAGESVLDIGCGPGYLCEEMSDLVGVGGSVVGVDISPDLIELCARRKHSRWLSYDVGDATRLSQPDASFDVAVCTQVAEYVADADTLLSEAFRILKPGGRTLFIATDWDALIWSSHDAKRMAAVLRSWEAHCSHPRLPRTMPTRLRNAGFRLDDASIYPIFNLSYDEENYSNGLSTLIQKFVEGRGDVSSIDLKEWLGEFEHLSDEGEYFFSLNRYIFEASRPALHTLS